MLNVDAKVTRVKKTFNFDSKKFITEALGIIKLDIQDGLNTGTDIKGNQFPKLEASTVNRKRKPHMIDNPRELATPAYKSLNKIQVGSNKKGASSFGSKTGEKGLNRQQARYISQRPNSPLMDGGNLWRNKTIEVTENEGTMRIGAQRAGVGKTLQIDGVGGKRWIFFGISDRAIAKIEALLKIRWKQSFEIGVKRG